MKLYRFLEGIDDYDDWKIIDDAWEKGKAPEGTEALRDMIGEETGEYMVPVEPCVHGKYDVHWPFTISDENIGLADEPLQSCPGAGLEDTE